MVKTKIAKKLLSIAMVFAFVASLIPAKTPSVEAIEETVSSVNPMLYFVMKARWGNVIGEPENIDETNFDGSVAVSSDARISLQRTLLFEKHNTTADKITSEKDPVSWTSLIYNHWDGIRVAVSSPANKNIVITTSQGSVTKTAQELYDMKKQYIQNLDNGKEIVIDVYPVKKSPNYFLKVFWGKTGQEDYVSSIGKCREAENGVVAGIMKCLLSKINADGSFKINSGGKLSLVKTLRFEGNDRIMSKTDTEIEWASRVYEGVDGILVNMKLDTSELDKSDTVTLNFSGVSTPLRSLTEKSDAVALNLADGYNWTKSFSIIDLYHNGITKETIEDNFGVVLQVWRKSNRSLIRVKNRPTVYMIEDGVKQPIPSEEVLASQGLTFDDVEVVEQEEADTYADGEAVNYSDGTIVQEEGAPEVYVIENGEKKHIQDPSAFVGLGYSWENIVRVKAGILGLYRNGNPLQANSIHPEGALIRVAGNPKVYVIEGGKKVPISNIQLFNARRYDWNKVLVVNENQAKKFELGKTLEYPDGSLLRARNGNVYRVNQGKKQWIRSADDFQKAGYKTEKILDVDDIVLSGFEEGIDVVADDVVE